MKKKFLASVAALAAFAVPQLASAQVSVVSSSPYGSASSGLPGAITFDPGSAAYQIGGNAKVVNGSMSGLYAAPATGPSQHDMTNYLAAFPSTSGMGAGSLFGFGLASAVTFYWGSIDDYNSLDFFNGDSLLGSVSGSMSSVMPNGDQASGLTNRTVSISSATPFDRLVFNTGQNAFEADNFSFQSAVPEPASWGMMILGFGAVGFAMRSRRRQGAVAAA